MNGYTDHVEPIPLGKLRDHLAALYSPALRAKSTRSSIMRILDKLDRLGGIETTADLTTATVARFIAAEPPGQHPNTTYTQVAKLRVVCNIAAAEGWLRMSPFVARRRWVRKITPAVPKVHSREEIARVLGLAAADVARKRGWAQWRARRLLALVAVVAYTGLRRNEALHLRVEDVDLSTRMLAIVARRDGNLKTDAAAQPVPIPDALAVILAGWIPHLATPPPHRHSLGRPGGRPAAVTRAGLREVDPGWLIPNAYRTGPWQGGSNGHKPVQRLKRLAHRAGVEGFTFQSLRHSWATHAEFWGLSDAMIQRVMRHSNTRTQQHYRHAEAANLRQKVGGIDFGPSPAAGGPRP